MAGNDSNRVSQVCLIAAAGLLLCACDKGPPTQPSPPPPPPRSSGPIAFVSNRDGTGAIYLANEDGSSATRLTMGHSPAWAKDGRQIAFGVGGLIHAIVVDGTGDRVVADNGQDPSWSPDGRALVFARLSGGSELQLVNPDGSNRRSLYDSGHYFSYGPKWSPDGLRILFSISNGYLDWCFGLWTVNADGSGARQLGGPGVGGPSNSCFLGVDASLSDAVEAAWSPDGSEIAFRSDRGIEVAMADGSGRHLRVPGPAFDPDWTPDGRLIYTKGPFDGPARIFISDGVTARQLIPDATAPAQLSYRDSQAVWRR